MKVTFAVNLPNICKDDLILIPRKLSKELGSCCEVLLCTKVRSTIHLLDLNTFKKIQISANQYFIYESQIQIFSIKIYGKKFNVLDNEAKDPETPNKYPTFGLTVMIEDEYKELYTRCHFNEEPGRDLLGFDLTQIENFEGIKNIPDYMMVQKIKDKEMKKKQKSKRRKRLAEERKLQSETASMMQREEEREISSSD